MIKRLFPADKNYILSAVQDEQKESLLQFLVEYVKQYYFQHYNPLGLEDDTVIKIRQAKDFPLEPLLEFYHDLAAIYRFKYGEVQLELLFDGSSHYDKYKSDWIQFFKQNIQSYCLNRFFIRAVLDISVFHRQDRVAELAGLRLKYFLSQYCGMKVYKFKGILSLTA